MNKLRVFQGPDAICGQAWALSKGLEYLGHMPHSGIVSINGESQNKYGYSYDIDIPFTDNKVESVSAFIEQNIDNYDVFHFHAKSFLYFNPWPAFPTCMDLLALRMAGKKVFFHFRGSEVRRKFRQLEKNPYNYVESAADAYSRSDQDKDVYVKLIKSICNGVFVVDREVNENVGGGIEIPICLDLADWKYVGPVRKDAPLIVHAPSHQGIKGTEEILNALEELKASGVNFEYRQIENMSNSEARALYEQADIVIDQLKMGWFGTLTVEAMALGKPVICYLRHDLLKSDVEFPIVNATPDDIKQVLSELIASPALRAEIGIKGRRYVEKEHCHIKAAKIASDTYADTHNDGHFNAHDFLEYVNAESLSIVERKKEYLRESRLQSRAKMLDDLREQRMKKIRSNFFYGKPGFGVYLRLRAKVGKLLRER
jgi:glycosyltransferase involved in cell wall biosynthesis